jgi:ATP-binding cassette subfamily C protein
MKHHLIRPPGTSRHLKSGMAACRNALFVVGLLSLGVSVLLFTLPLYMMQVYDRVLSSGSLDTLIMLTIAAAGALLLLGVFDTLRQMILARAGTRLEAAIGGPLLAAAFANRHKGEPSENQGLRDLWQLRMFLSGPVVVSYFDLPLAPLYVLVVFLIHPALGLIAFMGMVVLMLIAVFNQGATRTQVRSQSQHSIAALVKASEQVRNADVVQAMGMLPECVTAWGADNAKALNAMIASADRSAVFGGLSKTIRLLLQISLLGFGAYLVLQHEITAGMILAASILGARALAPVESSITGWRAFLDARDAYGRIKAQLNAAGEFVARTSLPAPTGQISVDQLVYVPQPGARPALKGLTFRIEAGDALGVAGPTGAGKSTLARLLVGAIRPSSGAVRLDGSELGHWNRDELGAHIGYLPQDVELFPGTVGQNIARLDPQARSEDIVAAAKFANVHELIARLPDGYETVVDPGGHSLSGGQKQSIALARAFYGQPRLIVLDEPNSSLDSEGEKALHQAITEAKQRQITVVVIAQRPAILRSVDTIMVLRDGMIDMCGMRDQVFSQIVKVVETKPAAVPKAKQAEHARLATFGSSDGR